jgi:hypothetical protein
MTTEQHKDVMGIAEATMTAFNTGDWAQFRAALASGCDLSRNRHWTARRER